MSVGSEKRPPSDHADAAKETQPSTRAIAIVSHKIDSSELFLNTREVIISHGSEFLSPPPDLAKQTDPHEVSAASRDNMQPMFEFGTGF